MSEPSTETSLTEGANGPTGEPPPPAEPSTDPAYVAEVEVQERKGWPDEPTTS